MSLYSKLAARLPRTGRLLSVLALLAAGAVLLLRPAHAAIITVNTTSDELNSDGDCSLREAIQAANSDTAVDACAAGSGADTIVVPAGTYIFSIEGANEDANASGDFDLTGDLTINGAGAATTVNGFTDRVFHVLGGAVELSGLTIQNGFAACCAEGTTPFGGGILNQGTLTLSNSSVNDNSAGAGGGIYNQGALTMNKSRVNDNSVSCCPGGGIYNVGTLNAIGSTMSGNSGEVIFNDGGTVTLSNSTVSGNSGGANGGIYTCCGGTVTFNSSTISGNSGPGVIVTAGGNSTLTFNNSTISGNTNAGGHGVIVNAQSTLTMNNSTVSGNSGTAIRTFAFCCFPATSTLSSSTVNGNLASDSGGAEVTTTLKNTIVTMATCSDYGQITSSGYNLIESMSCSRFSGDTATDIIGSDPLLGPLADNGGPTQTHALLSSSPAIDAANPVGCTDHTGVPLVSDQRGAGRHVDGNGDLIPRCDIGAYEFGATPPTPTPSRTPTSTATPSPVPPTPGPVGGISLDPTPPGGAGSGAVDVRLLVALAAAGAIAGAAGIGLARRRSG